MRKILCFLLLLFSFSSFANTIETYTMDPNHSYVLWRISHFNFSHPSGKWFVTEGKLSLDKDKPQNSKVNVTINVDKMVTGIPELDKHLKGPLFFDVKKFPQATFVSDSVSLNGKEMAQVHGNLTVHGVTKPVTLNVKLNKIGTSPITNKQTVGFTATTILNRSDFGIKTLLPGLGDQVPIDIEVEAYKS